MKYLAAAILILTLIPASVILGSWTGWLDSSPTSRQHTIAVDAFFFFVISLAILGAVLSIWTILA